MSDEIRIPENPMMFCQRFMQTPWAKIGDQHPKLSHSDLKNREKIYGKDSNIMKILHSKDIMPNSTRCALTERSTHLVRKVTNIVRKLFK